jgi:hypothetical protein
MGFFRFLDSALDAIRVECPAAYVRLCGLLVGSGLQLRVDGRARSFTVEGGRHRIGDSPSAGTEIRTDRSAVEALLEGRLSLVDAVLGERLSLRGAPLDIAIMHDALVVFLEGAVRSPSLPGLLDEYLADGRVEPRYGTSDAARSGTERNEGWH